MLERRKSLGVSSYRLPGGHVVVHLAGALDTASAPQLVDEMAAVDPQAGDRVVLHLADVTALDSAGVGALFYLEAFVRARRGRLVLAMPRRTADSTINRLTLERHFSFVDEPGVSRGDRDVGARRRRVRDCERVTVKEEL